MQSLLLLIIVLIAEFFLGFGFIKKRGSIWLSWIFPIAAVILIHIYTTNEPTFFRMIALILVLLTGMKVVVARQYSNLNFNLVKWFLYCFAWVGMNPEIFFKRRNSPDNNLLIRGSIFLFAGLTILLSFRFVYDSKFPPKDFIEFYGLSLLLITSLGKWLRILTGCKYRLVN